MLHIGRKGQLYVAKEGAYGEDPPSAWASGDALRHINVGFTLDPFNRVTSPEKKQSPGPVSRFDRRRTSELSTLEALLRPSGTLNTLPECDEILEAAFGSRTNVTLSTTVASGGSASGATLASAGALAVGDAVLLTRNAIRYVRVLTSVVGNAVTWAPDLPSVITNGEVVKGGITYKLTTNLAISLKLAHYIESFKRSVIGVGANSFSAKFDSNEEPRFTLSGPARDMLTGTTPAKPAAFTTVGGLPPSGLIGEVVIGSAGTSYLVKNFSFELDNALALRNIEYGNGGRATEVYRQGRRSISLALDAFLETEATLFDLAEAGTNTVVLKQTGRTEGNIVAVYAPRVEFKVPEQDDPDEEVNWSFNGMALESADGQNDELTLALM